MNILITSAGRRVSLIRSFQIELKKINTNSNVYTAEANPFWSSACRISDGFFILPKVNDTHYIERLLQLCIDKKITILIPTLDTELLILSKSKEVFENHNITIIISDSELVEICRDKRKSNKLFNSLGIRVPKTIDINNPTFPLFIKPYDGSLSKDTLLINSLNEISNNLIQNEKLMFMEYINPLDYYEFTLDSYYDKNSLLKCLVPRNRIEVRGGEISKGRTEKGKVYSILKEKLNYLKGARGCLTIQIFVGKKNNEIIGIEINPRFGGGYPLSYAAGANFPMYIIQEYLLLKEIEFYEKWVENRVMLRYDSEIILDENDFIN